MIVVNQGHLNDQQAQLLEGLVHGRRPGEMRAELGVDLTDWKQRERELTQALGGNNIHHAMAMAFEQGILKVLCLVLCVSALNTESMRLRTPKRPLTNRTEVAMRITRGGRNLC